MSKITVVARIRPSIVQESEADETFRISSAQLLEVGDKRFGFDHIFGPEADQSEVFHTTVNEIVDNSLAGSSGAIIAYGQTAAGKTHTMMGGNGEAEGIIPRTIRRIFRCQSQERSLSPDTSEPFKPVISLTYVEIYMDRVYDLLNNRSGVALLNDGTPRAARRVSVSNITESLRCIAQGTDMRSIASTKMNDKSSRSHSIVTIELHNGAKLMLVDLAGSETAKKSGCTGSMLREASEINKSLSSLANVVSALTSKQGGATPTYVPFRDSRLVQYLQPAFKTSSKTAMIINCSPSAVHLSESLQSLRFGVRAKQIKLKPSNATEKSDYEFWRFWNGKLSAIERNWEIFGPPDPTKLPDFTPFFDASIAKYGNPAIQSFPRLWSEVCSLSSASAVDSRPPTPLVMAANRECAALRDRHTQLQAQLQALKADIADIKRRREAQAQADSSAEPPTPPSDPDTKQHMLRMLNLGRCAQHHSQLLSQESAAVQTLRCQLQHLPARVSDYPAHFGCLSEQELRVFLDQRRTQYDSMVPYEARLWAELDRL